MATSLPYNLREGTIAYAGKVMANFRALLGILNNLVVEGVGTGDIVTILNLLVQSMVKADEAGNADDIVFEDGDTLEEKFSAGTLNASLLNSEGMFYFYVDPADGHLYVVAADGMSEDDFWIDEDGHLQYALRDPEDNSAVHITDLGKVKGDKGDAGAGGMQASTYDPNNVGKDVNTYTGYYNCYAADWSSSTYTISHDELISGADIDDHITATSGNFFIGPSPNATDDGVEAWANAMIRITGQGNGTISLKALGDVPTEDVELQITMFV